MIDPDARTVNELCDRFEDDLLAGRQPRIEDVLIAAGVLAQDALPELAAVELDIRLRAGEPAKASDYFARFPALAADPGASLRLVAIEFRAARDPDPADFQHRYPALAAHPGWAEGPWAVPTSGRETVSISNNPADPTGPAVDVPESPAAFLPKLLSPPDRPGDLGRLGDYRVTAILGCGGMGVVLRAEDDTLSRSVAIKLMRPEIAARPHSRERFLREGRAAAAITHPRVIPIFHVGEHAGIPYLVMPLLSGQSLAVRLKAGPPPDLGEAIRIAREVADGLAAAHARRLIHRDVKPDNVWLEQTDDGLHVRLLDFGLARAIGGELLTNPGVLIGTPGYMAPEQVTGGDVDHRADLFGLGCVLYELLTGRRPFVGEDILAVLTAVAIHDPPPAHSVNPAVPPAVSALASRLMAKDPNDRPASTAEVAAALKGEESTTVGGSPSDRAEAPQTLTGSRGSRRTLVAAVVAGIAVLGIVAVVARPGPRPPQVQPVPPAPDDGNRVSPPELLPPLRVKGIKVRHYARVGDDKVDDRGVIGRETFAATLGDQATIEVELSRQAYAYLLACRPDGVQELIFPERDDVPPSRDDRPRYPSFSRGKVYDLTDGAGLWVFSVVASDEPLPAYRDWLSNRKAKVRWVPETVRGLTVWTDDGTLVDGIGPQGQVSRGERGAGGDIPGRSAVVRVSDDLKAASGGGVVFSVGFSVLPRE